MPHLDLSGTITEAQVREAFWAVLGVEARVSDVQVVQLLGGTRASLADYVWDHWLGEPESPDVEEVQAAIDTALGV